MTTGNILKTDHDKTDGLMNKKGAPAVLIYKLKLLTFARVRTGHQSHKRTFSTGPNQNSADNPLANDVPPPNKKTKCESQSESPNIPDIQITPDDGAALVPPSEHCFFVTMRTIGKPSSP